VTLAEKLTNLLLYSSVFIAIGTVSLIQLNMELVSGKWHLDNYSIFAFFATIFLYSLHRLYGINRVKGFDHEIRFSAIKTYRSHVMLYCVTGAAGALIYFFQLPHLIKLLIVTPAVFSLLYVLPVFPGERRLRDFHFIKILAIAFVWAWITSFIPEYIVLGGLDLHQCFSFAERLLFFIAITIPFDIRDLEVDAGSSVKTIPSTIGISKSKAIAIICLILHLIIVISLSYYGYYLKGILFPYAVLFIVTSTLILLAHPKWSDYYYSGLLDGMMILQWLLVSTLI
jgi:4-hydroxybenzoate polyprenyltransferase